MRSRSFKAVGLSSLAGLFLAGTGLASQSATNLHAALTAQQSPPQLVRSLNGVGSFTGSVVFAGARGTLTWRLTYSKLSSRITNALIVFPPSGKKGQVTVQLCRAPHCTAIQSTNTTYLPSVVAHDLLKRPGYISIDTLKNPKGEIKGKLSTS